MSVVILREKMGINQSRKSRTERETIEIIIQEQVLI